jgi:hypothetical protein
MEKPRMAKHYRKMIVRGDHLEAADIGPPWTVLWETKAPPDDRWSAARADTEQAALERAAHFVKLGFIVFAIKDPTGAIFMDQGQIVGRFGANEDRPRSRRPGASPPSAEQAARQLLRSVIEEFQATPGQVSSLPALRALSASAGIGPAEFDRALDYAGEQGWIGVGTETVTLTQSGFTAAAT